MAKIKVFGTNYTLSSAYSIEELKEVNELFSEALTLKDENNEPYFSVALNEENDSVSKYGIVFAKNDLGNHACVSMTLPADVTAENVKSWILNKYTAVIHNLIEVERQITVYQADLDEMKEMIADSVVIIDD